MVMVAAPASRRFTVFLVMPRAAASSDWFSPSFWRWVLYWAGVIVRLLGLFRRVFFRFPLFRRRKYA